MKPRLLVVELHHLGDAVLSLPFVKGAGLFFDIHILCRPATRALYELLPQPPAIHVWEPPWADEAPCPPLAAIQACRAIGRNLRSLAPAVTVCAWADARAALIMAETGATQRIGFPMTPSNYYAPAIPWRRKRLRFGRLLEAVARILRSGQPLLTQKLQRLSSSQPHRDCWQQIASVLDVVCDRSVPWVQPPPIEPQLFEFCSAARRSGKEVLVAHPRATRPSKQWPSANWKTLFAMPAVGERFIRIEIVPPGLDHLLNADLAVTTPDIASLAAVLYAADSVLCHDSLPAHLAAALGKPVIAIFGSGEPAWFAPWNNAHRIVHQRVCPHHPCIDRCAMPSYVCLNAITPADVLRQLELLPYSPKL